LTAIFSNRSLTSFRRKAAGTRSKSPTDTPAEMITTSFPAKAVFNAASISIAAILDNAVVAGFEPQVASWHQLRPIGFLIWDGPGRARQRNNSSPLASTPPSVAGRQRLHIRPTRAQQHARADSTTLREHHLPRPNIRRPERYGPAFECP
jgi:hypothetical protein